MKSEFSVIAEATGLQSVDASMGGPRGSNTFRYGGQIGAETKTRCSRYLIASITKPIVGMAAVRLAAEGEFTLSERIGRLLPQFDKGVYRRITPRHLLTHTSGFPDMLPDNAALRAAHASLPDFVDRAAEVDLDFLTARDSRYSSVGFLLLGAIIEKITSGPAARFLQNEFFQPLEMNESWLGLPDDSADQLMPTVAPSILPEWQPDADDWGWNSRYWRTLGAPWGGMISTAADLGRFAEMMLSEGCSRNGKRIMPPEAVQAAMADQLQPISSQPGYVGPQRPWGFGWRHHWPDHFTSFGDFVSPGTVGHWGATGTVMWIDPVRSRYGVVLSTTPYEDSQAALQRLSNLLTSTPDE